MPDIFIDGEVGTTGLRIRERLSARADIRLLDIDPEKRKDLSERKKLINASDITFLCLPDAAAIEAAVLAEGGCAKLIDASTAHRTNPDWAYGFPELSLGHRNRLAATPRAAVPGCHATGFVSLVYPLTAAGIAAADYPFSCFSLTGYSGGGKRMIGEYTDPGREALYSFPRQYALSQRHKHLPEMQAVCALSRPPVFSPVIGDYYAGMEVTVPIHPDLLQKKLTADALYAFYAEYYAGCKLISVRRQDEGMTCAGALAGLDRLEILVCGGDERVVLIARFDNLGKGASGAAVQCMNLMCGFDETAGLSL